MTSRLPRYEAKCATQVLLMGVGPFVLCPPLRKRGAPPPKFSAHVYCGQMARWMKLVLGMEVSLSPGDFYCLIKLQYALY